MTSIEEVTDDVIVATVKVGKLSLESIVAALKWFVQNGQESKNFKEETGKMSMAELSHKANDISFISRDFNEKEVNLLASEFKKYNVMFAVEKQEEGVYKIAFAGKNEQTIEHAMKRVVIKLDRRRGKSRLQDVREKGRSQTNAEINDEREQERERVEERER